MTASKIASAALLSLLAITEICHAADPEFKVARVTESRAYEREKAAVSVAGVRTAASKEWTSRVTVALEGERITGEWVPKTTISASAKDFRRGADVSVALRRNQLLLKHPDGSVVTAKIVRRVKQPTEADDRD